MEKFLTKINSHILDLKYRIILGWTFLLKSKITLAIVLVVMVAVLTYLNYFFYEILFKPFWILFLLTSIFILVTVILPGFLLVGGTDIYKNMRDSKEKVAVNNVVDSIEGNGIAKSGNMDEKFIKSENKNERDGDIIITESEITTYIPASIESIKVLFDHLKDKSFFDVTMVRDKNHLSTIESAGVFEREYFEEFINDVRCYGETTKRLYLFADQKTVGFLIFEVFKPIMKRDVSKISEYFYYYQLKNGFKPIKYESIISPSKRSIHPPTHKFLPEFFLKFRSDLQ